MLKPKYKLSRGPAFTFSLLDAHRCCLTQGCRTCSPFAKCGLRGHFKRFATLDSGYAVHGPAKSASHFCVGATAFFCYFRHPRCVSICWERIWAGKRPQGLLLLPWGKYLEYANLHFTGKKWRKGRWPAGAFTRSNLSLLKSVWIPQV